MSESNLPPTDAPDAERRSRNQRRADPNVAFYEPRDRREDRCEDPDWNTHNDEQLLEEKED